MTTVKVKVYATAKHPTRKEGEEYLLALPLVEVMRRRGFVLTPEDIKHIQEEREKIQRTVKVVVPENNKNKRGKKK